MTRVLGLAGHCQTPFCWVSAAHAGGLPGGGGWQACVWPVVLTLAAFAWTCRRRGDFSQGFRLPVSTRPVELAELHWTSMNLWILSPRQRCCKAIMPACQQQILGSLHSRSSVDQGLPGCMAVGVPGHASLLVSPAGPDCCNAVACRLILGSWSQVQGCLPAEPESERLAATAEGCIRNLIMHPDCHTAISAR